MISKGNQRKIKVLKEIVSKESGLTASQIRDRMVGHPTLAQWGAPNVHCIGQLLRAKPFTVVGRLSNNTKTYAICEGRHEE
jgi:hypothetical protein